MSLYSLCALSAVRDAMPDVEVIPKECPVGDHAANRAAENATKEIKKQIRVLKSSQERREVTTCSGISSDSHVVAATRCKIA